MRFRDFDDVLVSLEIAGSYTAREGTRIVVVKVPISASALVTRDSSNFPSRVCNPLPK